MATGFHSMNRALAPIISEEVADKVGKCWGLGSGVRGDPGSWEGEPRNMWKPTQQPGLWFHGGNLALSRHYSLVLAPQIKARRRGCRPQSAGCSQRLTEVDARGVILRALLRKEPA
jgi:putative flavoprotein involved in K+ transport